MRLKEIKLAGFKSFVDPTTVSLPGNRGVVVGPNGCGKSNIIDAVRWVLGESSARQLRGEALTDVIFNGSNSRQPASLAAIELVFDNRDARPTGEFAKSRFASYAELAIRREVNREAQSTYYLNGTRCRRRDIADVFLGTGFGPRSYSIIEQNMIAQLVEAKPDVLRTYLEEAAGISKYRERRRETQNRMKHTVENLERLGDVIDELDKQLAHLKRQAKAAERYNTLKEQKRQRTAQWHAIRLLALGSELDGQEARTKALDAEHEAALAARQTIDTGLEQDRAAHAELADEQATVQGGYYRAGAEAARVEEAIEFGRKRLAQQKADLDQIRARQHRAVSELETDMAHIARMKAGVEERVPDIARAEDLDAKATARLERAEERVHASQNAWEDFAERAARNAGDIQLQRSRIEHGEQVLQRLRARSALLDSEPGVVTDPGVERLARQLDGLEHRLATVDAEIRANDQGLAGAREAVEICERALEQARTAAQTARAELAALSAVQASALGKANLEDAVERWLADHGLEDAPRLGERLTVEPGWETAVETVLGSGLEAIEVADTGALAARLGELAGGRLVLFESTRTEIEPTPRGLPLLAEFVRPEFGALLVGVFAAKSMTEALRHRSRLQRGQSIVTADGVWLGVDWVRFARLDEGTDESGGVVQRARQIEALDKALDQAEADLAEQAARLAEARRQTAALEDQREGLHEQRVELTAEFSRVRTEHDVRQVRVEEAAARARRNASERDENDVQIETDARDLESRRERLAELETDAQSLAGEGESLRTARDADTAERESALTAARETREALHRLRIERQGLEASLEAAETARDRLESQRRDFEERAHELRGAVTETEAEMPAQRKILEAKLAERLELEQRLADLRRRMEAVEADIRTRSAKRNEVQQTVDEARSRLEDARVQRERLAADRDNLLAQLAETGIGFEEAREGLAADATEEQLLRAVERLDKRIHRLGEINQAAIGDYEVESERRNHLDRQREDLETALATLRDAIRRIDRETRVRFKDTFDRVNQQLDVLFPKFFGGGHAYLTHTGPDWLDTGVTVMARPPGKRNASINSLSGGEKAMAAVALIFSIFQLNPSPVCLLDEVDASLDDLNVDRFADLIREMSDDVQFVVITHNKRTIAMADHLLGVTMQEPGVSRLVSVDVESTVQTAAG